jgi:hypothetical protein
LADSCRLDLPLTWTPEREIVLKLVMGDGPVSISGNHFVDTADESEDPEYVPGESTDDTAMDSEDEGSGMNPSILLRILSKLGSVSGLCYLLCMIHGSTIRSPKMFFSNYVDFGVQLELYRK